MPSVSRRPCSVVITGVVAVLGEHEAVLLHVRVDDVEALGRPPRDLDRVLQVGVEPARVARRPQALVDGPDVLVRAPASRPARRAPRGGRGGAARRPARRPRARCPRTSAAGRAASAGRRGGCGAGRSRRRRSAGPHRPRVGCSWQPFNHPRARLRACGTREWRYGAVDAGAAGDGDSAGAGAAGATVGPVTDDPDDGRRAAQRGQGAVRRRDHVEQQQVLAGLVGRRTVSPTAARAAGRRGLGVDRRRDRCRDRQALRRDPGRRRPARPSAACAARSAASPARRAASWTRRPRPASPALTTRTPTVDVLPVPRASAGRRAEGRRVQAADVDEDGRELGLRRRVVGDAARRRAASRPAGTGRARTGR